MFHANLESTVWNRHVGAQLLGLQHGGRKSMKTSGIKFYYKKRSNHPHEQVKIHKNTSCKSSTVHIVKNRRMRHFLKNT